MRQQASTFFNLAAGMFRQTARKTAAHLHPEEVHVFTDLSNDAIGVTGAIHNTYPADELVHSLVWFDFAAFAQQLVGMGFDLLCGRYAEVRRAIRFAWESIARAYYADCFRALKPNASDPPGPTVDDKNDWLAGQKGLNWRTVIAPVLRHLRRPADDVENRLKPLWDRLNAAAHPSGEWRERGVEESARHVWFYFDEQQARELVADARAVFHVVWLMILDRFPLAVPPMLADADAFRVCPQIRADLEARLR